METTPPMPEQQPDGEKLFESFHQSLKLVVETNQKAACGALGIDRQKLSNVAENFSLKELEIRSEQLRVMLFDGGDLTSRYDAIISTYLAAAMSEEPGKYEALADPDLLKLAMVVAKGGLLFEFASNRVEKARAQRRHSRQMHHRHHGGTRVNRDVLDASKVDQLIDFNHMVRDLIEENLSKKMPLDRTKIRSLLGTLLMGDYRTAAEVERGVSLEVATKKMIEGILTDSNSEGTVEYGGREQDRRGGDLVLRLGSAVKFIDTKSTPPHEIRHELDGYELGLPGHRIKRNGKSYLWMGRDLEVGEHFEVPYAYQAEAEQLVHQLVA